MGNQLAEELTRFVLEGNESRAALHRVNHARLHLEGVAPLRAHEDHRPLRYGGEHLESQRVRVKRTPAAWRRV